MLEVGFATFYLNRTNRSGIISNAGPIGGFDQTGPWKIDARYNRKELPKRIERIALYRNRISFQNKDAIAFINGIRFIKNLFVYLDPPYFAKGKELYLNHYDSANHRDLASYMKCCDDFLWVMSYDKIVDIERLYKPFRQVCFTLSYSASVRRKGREVLILGKGLKFPREWRNALPSEALRAE
jgi:DNA adenine methylase